MKTISIPNEIREILDSYANGESMNKAMRRLLADVETRPVGKSTGQININMDDDLLIKLNGCRLYPTEPYGSVIYRLINQQK